MKLAMLACLAALCLTGSRAHAAPGEPAKGVTPAPSTAAPAAQVPAPTAVPGQAAPRTEQAAPRGEQTAPRTDQAAPRSDNTGRAERRRRSYAACNRASHQRNLRGGRRRRFMIRCRLGYERTRQQQIQAPAPVAPTPAAPAPAPPGRKP